MAPHPVLLGLRIEVHRLLGFILKRPIGDGENPSRATEPRWDSLKHVELIFLLEDYFGVRFAEQEISDLEDAAGIVRLIESKNKGDVCITA